MNPGAASENVTAAPGPSAPSATNCRLDAQFRFQLQSTNLPATTLAVSCEGKLDHKSGLVRMKAHGGGRGGGTAWALQGGHVT